MALPFPNSQQVQVTVQANKRLTMDVNGTLLVYTAGQVVWVAQYSVVYLRRDGIVV